MAKEIDFQLLPSITVPGCYAIVGDVRLSLFHQTCEVDFFVYASEDARRQRLSEAEHELHRPLKIITIRPTIGEYQAYLEQPAKLLARACYQMATEVEEGGGASPRGLKNLLAEAKDI